MPSILLGAFVFLLLSLLAVGDELSSLILHLDRRIILPVLALVLANYALRFGRWCYYLTALEISVPFGENAAIFLSGLVMAASPGKLGEVLKSYLLRLRTQAPLTKSLPAVMAERVTDVSSLVLIFLASAGAAGFGGGAAVAFGGLVVAGLWLLTRQQWIERMLRRAEQTRFGAQAARAVALYRGTAALLRPAPLLVGTALGAVGWSCECTALYVLCRALGGNLAWTPAACAFALSTLVGALSFLPGGLFAAEGSLAVVLLQMSQSPAVAAATTVGIRLSTLWFAVGVGALSLFSYQRWLRAHSTATSESVLFSGAVASAAAAPGREAMPQ
ncbi:MAG: flippase-like domain-containing protein [Candidatus Schekmanbacteria bacterium]|nr:flippase-like domain-containing protein [Candidatus Schekmanbacteria bacterium]